MNKNRKYNIGGVMVETDNSVPNKFRVLKMAMDNWARKNHLLSIDSPKGRKYRDDVDRYNKLKELFEYHKPNFIKKQHMVEVNDLFKMYNNG